LDGFFLSAEGTGQADGGIKRWKERGEQRRNRIVGVADRSGICVWWIRAAVIEHGPMPVVWAPVTRFALLARQVHSFACTRLGSASVTSTDDSPRQAPSEFSASAARIVGVSHLRAWGLVREHVEEGKRLFALRFPSFFSLRSGSRALGVFFFSPSKRPKGCDLFWPLRGPLGEYDDCQFPEEIVRPRGRKGQPGKPTARIRRERRPRR